MSHHHDAMLTTVLKVYGLKKDRLGHQIYQVNDSISKKKQSIAKFEEYEASYRNKYDSSLAKNSQILINHQAFYQNLAKVIASEQHDLLKLTRIRDELVASCCQFMNKIDGLEAMRAKNLSAKQLEQDNAEDNALSDLAVVTKGVKKAWEL